MNILLVHNYYQNRGGADRYHEMLARLLESKGHNVKKYNTDSKTIKTPFQKAKATMALFKGNQELAKQIKRLKPDIVQCQNIYPLISPEIYQMCSQLKIPIIQRISNFIHICFYSLNRKGKFCDQCIKKRTLLPGIWHGCYHGSRLASLTLYASLEYHKKKGSFQKVNSFIFPSSFVRDYQVANSFIPLEKTVVIPNFAEPPKKKRRGKEGGYFLYVGRLSPEKGIMKLLSLFSLLPEYTLVVIGDGPLSPQVQSYRQYDNIKILGKKPHNETVSYIRQALATIIPSITYDVLPNVMIESFSQGTPVIAPRAGSFLDSVNPELGFLYEPEQEEELKNTIIYLGKNKKKVLEMEQNILKHYRGKYTPDIHYEKLIALYRSVIEKIK